MQLARQGSIGYGDKEPQGHVANTQPYRPAQIHQGHLRKPNPGCTKGTPLHNPSDNYVPDRCHPASYSKHIYIIVVTRQLNTYATHTSAHNLVNNLIRTDTLFIPLYNSPPEPVMERPSLQPNYPRYMLQDTPAIHAKPLRGI